MPSTAATPVASSLFANATSEGVSRPRTPREGAGWPARVAFSVGEAYDFACAPTAPGRLRLELWSVVCTKQFLSVPVRVE